MSRLTRDGTAEPVSRDQILRHARGQGNVHFPCSADHEQDWQPYPVDPYSAICDDHTYIHTYIHIARVWINRVRLPILLVVGCTEKMNISLSPFAPENLVSRDRFGSPVLRQPAILHIQAGSGAYIIPPEFRRPLIIYFKPPYAIGSVPSLSGHAIAYRWRSLPRVRRPRASKPQGRQFRTSAALAGHHGPIHICASLSQTHYWYEVGIFKVPAGHTVARFLLLDYVGLFVCLFVFTHGRWASTC